MRDRNMKPEHLRTLDNAFKVLMEFPTSHSGMSLITDTLHECFGDDFSGSVVSAQPDVPMFVMSIFPERSTTDKIIESVANGNSNFNTIQSLWEKNTKWTIEIDERILKDTFTTRELTAMLLHEVGHLIESKTIASRVITVLLKSSMIMILMPQGLSKLRVLLLPRCALSAAISRCSALILRKLVKLKIILLKSYRIMWRRA